MKWNRRFILPLALLVALAVPKPAHGGEVMRLPTERVNPNTFFVDGGGRFWLSTPTGILCFQANGKLEEEIVTTYASFAVGSSYVFVFPYGGTEPIKRGFPPRKIAPGPHTDIYWQSEPDKRLEWLKTVWEPKQIIQDIAYQPKWVDGNSLLWFRHGDFAVGLNEQLEVVKQRPLRFLNQGTNGLLYETQLVWTDTLPHKVDHYEVRLYDQDEKLITVVQDKKSGLGLVRNCRGEVEYVMRTRELWDYDKSGMRTRTIKTPPHDRTGCVGPDGNYYYTDTKGKELVVMKLEIPKR